MSTSGLLLSCAILRADDYMPGPDSQRVPKDTVTKHEWTSKLYPGTYRNYFVYVPPCTIVFDNLNWPRFL